MWDGQQQAVVAVTDFPALPLPTNIKAHQHLPFPHTWRDPSTFQTPAGQYIPIDQDSSLKSCCGHHTGQSNQDNNFKSIKMFSPRVLVAIVAFASTTFAAPKLEAKSVATNNTCWYCLRTPSFCWHESINTLLRSGNIGEPCYGHTNGCALTGAMVSFYCSLPPSALPSDPIDQLVSSSLCTNR